MRKPLPMLVPVSRLMRFAELRPASRREEEAHESYPIPLPGPEGLLVAFLHCEASSSAHGLLLSPPSYLSYWKAETGAFEELKTFSPAELEIAMPKDQWLGTYLAPEERAAPEFVSRKAQFLRCYDLLLTPFATSMTELPFDVRSAASEFRALSPALLEKPLLPYYEQLGARFFAWLRDVSG